MTNVELIVKIGNQSRSISYNTSTPELELKLIQFLSLTLKTQVTLEQSEEPKEQLLNEVKNETNYNTPRPAPLGNHRSGGMGDPFQGTLWGVNKK